MEMMILKEFFNSISSNAPIVTSLVMAFVFLGYTYMKLKKLSVDSYDVSLTQTQKQVENLQNDNHNLRQSLNECYIKRDELMLQLVNLEQQTQPRSVIWTNEERKQYRKLKGIS